MQQFDLFTKEDAVNSTLEDTQSSTISHKVKSVASTSKRRQLLPDVSQFFDGELHYVPQWLSSELADKLFSVLQQKLAWKQEQIKVYGKWHTSPRLQAWYGGSDAAYQYSGVMMEPIPWVPELSKLKEACEKLCTSEFKRNTEFNSVLANLYRSGEDSMGFHSDDEQELGVEPVIASVTLGGERNFDLVHKQKPYKLRLTLPSGSLLVMKGQTQKNWLHGVPKTKKFVTPRINLTFRYTSDYRTG